MSTSESIVTDCYNRLRDKNAQHFQSQKQEFEDLLRKTHDVLDQSPPTFGKYFLENRGKISLIIFILVLYLVSNSSDLGQMAFLNFVTWNKEQGTQFNLTEKAYYLAAVLLCILLQFFGANMVQKKIGNKISVFFSNLIFQRLLEADVYKVLNN